MPPLPAPHTPDPADKTTELRRITSIDELVDQRLGTVEGQLAHSASLNTLVGRIATKYDLDLEDDLAAYITATLWAASIRAVAGLIRSRERDIFRQSQTLEGPDNGSYDAASLLIVQRGSHKNLDRRIAKHHSDILEYEAQLAERSPPPAPRPR